MQILYKIRGNIVVVQLKIKRGDKRNSDKVRKMAK